MKIVISEFSELEKWKLSLHQAYFRCIFQNYFYFESIDFGTYENINLKSLWNWFSNTRCREPNHGMKPIFFCEKPKPACSRSHKCEKIFVTKMSFISQLVNEFLSNNMIKSSIFLDLSQKNKEIEKIKCQLKKDKKIATSKNELTSCLEALNQKLWPFYDFFTDMKCNHWPSIFRVKIEKI